MRAFFVAFQPRAIAHEFQIVKKGFCLLILLFNLVALSCAFPSPGVPPKVSTSEVNTDADDCAILIHPTAPEKSVVIGTDKGKGGGLFVWNLAGEQLQFISLEETNNVDLRQNVMIGGTRLDVAVVNLQRAKEVKVYQIDSSSGELLDITTAGGIHTPELEEPYGFCLYRRIPDGALFFIESSKSGRSKSNLQQYLLSADGNGKVRGKHVRSFGNNSILDKVEGLVADDELGYVYASDESKAVRKYYADPEMKNDDQITAFATGDGFKGDREGIGIYKCSDGAGYLIISSQDNKSVKIYRREGEKDNPHQHDLVTTVMTSGSNETDGLEVTSSAAGPTFPNGLLAKHNSKGKNFAFYAWEEIAEGKLTICKDGKKSSATNGRQ